MDIFTLVSYAFLIWLTPAVLFCIGSLGWWAWKTYHKKRWWLLSGQLLLLAAILFAITWEFEVFPGARVSRDRHQTRQITGVGFVLDQSFTYESPRHFNGDGYSIWIYDLDAETAQQFIEPQSTFFDQYPTKGPDRSHWEHHQTWQRTPVQLPSSYFMNFILWNPNILADDSPKKTDLLNQYQMVRSILEEPGSYYAYTYSYLHSGFPGDIDFYILSPTQRKFVVINHNT